MAKQTTAELRKQYQTLADECAKLAPRVSAAERSRIQSGSAVNLSDEAKKFKDLMKQKADAFRLLRSAQEEEQKSRDVEIEKARRLLESAGQIAPRSESHRPAGVVKDDDSAE